MGLSISTPVTTLQWVLTELTKTLHTIAFIVSLTSITLTTHATNFAERAEAQISMIFMDIEEFLSELAMHGEQVQTCIAAKKPQLDKVRNDMVAQLLECYKSQIQIFDRLQSERAILHSEALKLKTDAEQMVANCTGSIETKFKYLSQVLSKLNKQVKALVKKVETHSKKEFEERRKFIIQLMTCDRKTVECAYKAVEVVVDEIKVCMLTSEPAPTPYTVQQE